MTYIENIFLCLALPMLLSLLFTSGSPRRFTLFVVLGMATCLLSAYVSSFFMGRHQCSAVTTAIEIAPVCEEILKLLPLLLYFLIFEPDSHKLTPAAIGIAVGFATFENVCYLTENGAGSFVFLLIRGMSAGALHLVCGILTGLALAYVFRRPWLTCTGTVGILGVWPYFCSRCTAKPPNSSFRYTAIIRSPLYLAVSMLHTKPFFSSSATASGTEFVRMAM